MTSNRYIICLMHTKKLCKRNSQRFAVKSEWAVREALVVEDTVAGLIPKMFFSKPAQSFSVI